MSKTQYDITGLSVCGACNQLLANGEIDDGTDTTERIGNAMVDIWGDNARHLVPGGEELGHCSTTCDTCGDTVDGDRFTASAVIPVRSNYQQRQLDRLNVWPNATNENTSVKMKLTSDDGETHWMTIPPSWVARLRDMFGEIPD